MVQGQLLLVLLLANPRNPALAIAKVWDYTLKQPQSLRAAAATAEVNPGLGCYDLLKRVHQQKILDCQEVY